MTTLRDLTPDDPAADDGWFDDDEAEDELDLYEDDCGMTDEGLCMYAGSEYCDWSCPLEKLRRHARTALQDAKGGTL